MRPSADICEPSGRNEWRTGGPTLIAAAIGCALGYSLYVNTAGLFILPMQAEFGWTRTELAIGPMVGLLSAMIAPLAGFIVDHMGLRRAAILGLAMSCLLFVALASVPDSRLALYGIGVAIAFFSAFSGPMVFTKGVATWFRRHIGLALGFTTTLLSLTMAVVAPLITYAIGEYGWRNAYLLLAAMVGGLAIPMALAFFREDPAILPRDDPSQAGGVPFGMAFRDVRFWLLLAFFVASAIGIGGYMSQVVPIFAARGFTPQSAATMAAVYFIAAAIGRTVFGLLLDHIVPAVAAAAAVLIAAGGAAMLLGSSIEGAVAISGLAIFLIGLAHGADVDFIAFFIIRVFGLRAYGALYGVFGGMATGAGFAVGGLVFAALFDRFGRYDEAIAFSIVSFCLAAAVMIVFGVVDGRQRTMVRGKG